MITDKPQPVVAAEQRKNRRIVRVTDADLAKCLNAVGVELDEGTPYTHLELCNGEERWVFNFEDTTSDLEDSTEALISAYADRENFIAENPGHPFTFAMCALINHYKWEEFMGESKPWVTYRSRGRKPKEFTVIKGSEKEKNLIAKGLRRADPFAAMKTVKQDAERTAKRRVARKGGTPAKPTGAKGSTSTTAAKAPARKAAGQAPTNRRK